MDELQIPHEFPKDEPHTPPEGLHQAEAEEKIKAGLGNVCSDSGKKTFWQVLAGNLLTWFNLLNVLLGICLILVGSYRNMLFLMVVVINAVIGTVQELRARSTIEKLQVLNMPVVTTLRDGKEVEIPSEQLVKGDLVILRSGNQVPADAVITEGGGAANESLLTGESDAVKKGVGDWLMSGSYISEGRFTAQLIHVGDESYAARLTRSARQIKRPQSQLMVEIDRLIRFVSMILLPLGALLFCRKYFLEHTALNMAVPSTVAAMIGMIPEGLVLLTSVAMALGVIRLGQKQTLVQELSGIETLARADVLCLDKTGTLTSGSMTLDHLQPAEVGEEELRKTLACFLFACDDHSGTMDAIREAIPADVTVKERIRKAVPFSSKRKLSAVSIEGMGTLILGAPSFVLAEHYPAELRKSVEEAADAGYRTLMLAQTPAMIEGEEPPTPQKVLGLVCLTDTLRPNVCETMRYFTQQGVTLKVISGDDPRTVSHIAKRVGLPGWENRVDATTLETEEDLDEAVKTITVFGRVTPVQKQRLVEALKRAGHSVAMTGDGVNDIPALKTADCSIAMAGGSDAAKHIAQLTLLNADFSSMPEIVAQGRRVIANITRSATLFLTKTLYSMILTLIMLIFPGSYPFQPIQLTLISSLFIGAPSFVLALEPNTDRMQGKFLRRVLAKALPGAVAVAACASLAMQAERWFACSPQVCSTLATLATGFVSLLTLIRVAWPMNKLRIALVCTMTLGFVLGVAILGKKVFLLEPLVGSQWGILAGLCAVGGVIFLLLMLLTRKLVRNATKG